MDVVRCSSSSDLGQQAAIRSAGVIKQAVAQNGEATIIVATGESQFETLAGLVQIRDVPWDKVRSFHLDEYIGIDSGHRASFCKYLQERFVDRVPVREFHFINGMEDPDAECERLNALISQYTIDLALIGIGENCHLAFNDPPADFETPKPYIPVVLDDDCRLQQVSEGWFDSFEEVPERAISMSVSQIMRCENLVCSVPGARKAEAIKKAVEGPVTPQAPASILQRHEQAFIYVDPPSASQLSKAPRAARQPASNNMVESA